MMIMPYRLSLRSSLDIYVDLTKLRSLAEHVLSMDKPLQGMVPDWEGFKHYTLRLLAGEEFSSDELQSAGLDPTAVEKRAKSILRDYKIEKGIERNRALANERRALGYDDVPLSRVSRGTDPIAFEYGLEEEE